MRTHTSAISLSIILFYIAIIKKTAIAISMNRTNGAVDGEQRMTSVEIAELTGKQHCHVMEEKNSARLLRRNRADKY